MRSVADIWGMVLIASLGLGLAGCAATSGSSDAAGARQNAVAPVQASASIPSLSPAGVDTSRAAALLPSPGTERRAQPGEPQSENLLSVPLRRNSPAIGDSSLHALERARRAQSSKRRLVEGLFARASVAFPPAELMLRGYKHERELEVWAASEAGGEMVLVTRYEVCAASGELGPKRREGDGQVPEGYYKIHYLWPNSDFYLAMKVGYPNLSDKVLGDREMPGSDIMIHGGCASIGCLAMTDDRIQELWVMASAVQGRNPVQVQLYPTRRPEQLQDLPKFSQHQAFWHNLYEGHALFERDRRLPRVRVKWDGRYAFASAPL